MAGYAKNREANYEIKYLRKVLTQVDKRVQVPDSINAAALLPLLDSVEPVKTARQRPRWLSLQSGIAYAAAFALIVALFYSMELYRPDMIDGGLRISETDALSEDAVKEAAAVELSQTDDGADFFLNDDELGTDPTEPISENASSESVSDKASSNDPAQRTEHYSSNVGGSARAVLLQEDQNRAYYGRINDESDPDRQAPVTLEIVNKETHEMTAQLNIQDMSLIEKCFIYGDFIVAAGNGQDGVAVHIYDNSDNPAEQLALYQDGVFTDASLYNGVLYIASISEFPPKSAELTELPYAASEDSCIITAIDLSTLENTRKAFVGANGTVKLNNLNAQVLYDGNDEGDRNYSAQILFDGIDMELDAVS